MNCSIDISAIEANLLSRISTTDIIPNIVLEIIAVKKGLITREGDIPYKKKFEEYIKQIIGQHLCKSDKRWHQNYSIKSILYSSSNISLSLNLDFVYFDDNNKHISIRICDFSDSDDKSIKKSYMNVSFVTRAILKEYWKDYKVDIAVIQYIPEYDNREEHWLFNEYRLSKIEIPNYHKYFDIHLAIERLDKATLLMSDYSNPPIDYEDLPFEARFTIDELENIKTSVYLVKSYLKQAKTDSEWNKRRIHDYIENDQSLASLPSDLLQLYTDVKEWYNFLSIGKRKHKDK